MLQPGTYYFKDRDHTNKTVYVLVLDGQRAGTTKTKAEAEEWYRRLTA